jgi:LacI family transcriptional regulator
LIHFLRATGRRIPEEVAVVGYGDLLPDYLRAIGLTTVAQTFIEVGLKAGAIMLKRLSLPSSATIRNEEIRLRVRLVERDSCGPNNAMPHAPSAKTESI